jgi:hypothetical protein
VLKPKTVRKLKSQIISASAAQARVSAAGGAELERRVRALAAMQHPSLVECTAVVWRPDARGGGN